MVASLELVPATSQLRASVMESALSIRIDNWRFIYTIDPGRGRIAVIDAEL